MTGRHHSLLQSCILLSVTCIVCFWREKFATYSDQNVSLSKILLLFNMDKRASSFKIFEIRTFENSWDTGNLYRSQSKTPSRPWVVAAKDFSLITTILSFDFLYLYMKS